MQSSPCRCREGLSEPEALAVAGQLALEMGLAVNVG